MHIVLLSVLIGEVVFKIYCVMPNSFFTFKRPNLILGLCKCNYSYYSWCDPAVKMSLTPLDWRDSSCQPTVLHLLAWTGFSCSLPASLHVLFSVMHESYFKKAYLISCNLNADRNYSSCFASKKTLKLGLLDFPFYLFIKC